MGSVLDPIVSNRSSSFLKKTEHEVGCSIYISLSLIIVRTITFGDIKMDVLHNSYLYFMITLVLM